MTIYLDVIWFLNFCIDYLLIWITAYALKRPFSKWRFLFAAFIASTIVLLLFTPFSSLFYQPLGKLLFSIMIVMVAFGFKNFRYFLQNLFMFYFVTFMVGGGLFALHYFWQSDLEIIDGVILAKTTGFGHPFSWIFVIIGIPLMIYFSKQQFKQVKIRKIDYEQIVTVEVELNGIVMKAKGLIDSGNQLFDPITKAPVMILEKKIVEQVFPNLTFDIDQLHKIDQLANKLRIVPYRVVGKNQDFLIAFKPDQVTIYDHSKKYTIKKVLVGIESMNLSKDGDYQSIVHPKMLENGDFMKLA